MSKFSLRLGITAIIFSIGAYLHYIIDADQTIQLAVFLTGYLIIGYDVLIGAARNCLRGQFLDENMLMVIATIAAFVIGEYPEAVAVMMFFQVGEWFERRAVNNTRASIADLMDIQPDYANVVRDGKVVQVAPEEIEIGELIEIKPGEKVPLDGTVIEGHSTLDTKALTGESMPRDISEGQEIISGTINLTSKLIVKVSKQYDESTVAKVLELVEESVSRKAPAERFITKFARYYTPSVVLAAFLVAVIPIALGYSVHEWVYKAITFLVVSCPCALVISVPLSYFCAIGAASRMGVLIKGGNYLEALSRADTVVFDKTGTLTEGKFSVASIHAIKMDEKDLLKYASHAETVSNHPIAKSIINSYNAEIDNTLVGDAEEIPGLGVRANIGNRVVHVGNSKLMDSIGVEYCKEDFVGTNIHVAIDREYHGHIMVEDAIKKDTPQAIDKLKSKGIKTVMLSGDAKKIAEKVGNELGIGEIRSELLPADKTTALEEILNNKADKTVIYVGDGINDAPSLARSDIGIAMGALGSDAAIEAADVVIMDDSPSRIPATLELAKRTDKIVKQNIIFALAVKFAIMGLSLFGLANMWMAVFGDVGVTVIAVLNAMRCQS